MICEEATRELSENRTVRVGIRKSLEQYKQGRTTLWDKAKEELPL